MHLLLPFFLHHGFLQGKRFLQNGRPDLQAVSYLFQREAKKFQGQNLLETSLHPYTDDIRLLYNGMEITDLLCRSSVTCAGTQTLCAQTDRCGNNGDPVVASFLVFSIKYNVTSWSSVLRSPRHVSGKEYICQSTR